MASRVHAQASPAAGGADAPAAKAAAATPPSSAGTTATTAGAEATASTTTASGWSEWSSGTARAIPVGRVEVGLLGPLKLGLVENVELSAQPILFFLMPHVDARWSFAHEGRYTLAFEPSIAYPTLLLRLLARNGTGFLPADAKVPHGLLLRAGFAASLDHGGSRVSTFRTALAFGPHLRSANFPILDFPLLYPRFAPLYGPMTARFELRSEGVIVGPFDYLVHASLTAIPAVSQGWAFEQGAFARWRFHDRFALGVGYLLSVARYPAGILVHALPLLEFEAVLRESDGRRRADTGQ